LISTTRVRNVGFKRGLFDICFFLTHIPHPKLSQREITERKNQSEHKNKHKERKKAFEKQ
jgi:hypothetical protein